MFSVTYIQGPVYLSFDIDAIDPGFCPGTGTPEIGGLTSIQVKKHEYTEHVPVVFLLKLPFFFRTDTYTHYQAIEVIRGCRGLNLVKTKFFKCLLS